jgi:hypothetical protein
MPAHLPNKPASVGSATAAVAPSQRERLWPHLLGTTSASLVRKFSDSKVTWILRGSPPYVRQRTDLPDRRGVDSSGCTPNKNRTLLERS